MAYSTENRRSIWNARNTFFVSVQRHSSVYAEIPRMAHAEGRALNIFYVNPTRSPTHSRYKFPRSVIGNQNPLARIRRCAQRPSIKFMKMSKFLSFFTRSLPSYDFNNPKSNLLSRTEHISNLRLSHARVSGCAGVVWAFGAWASTFRFRPLFEHYYSAFRW